MFMYDSIDLRSPEEKQQEAKQHAIWHERRELCIKTLEAVLKDKEAPPRDKVAAAKELGKLLQG